MIISVGKWLERLKFILLFLVLTLLFSKMFGALTAWIEPQQKYREPKGNAVKVFGAAANKGAEEEISFKERLKLFYWIGE